MKKLLLLAVVLLAASASASLINLAVNKFVDQSSCYNDDCANYGGQKLVDGNNATYWYTDQAPRGNFVNVTLDLNDTYSSQNSIVIIRPAAANVGNQLYIYSSADNSSWSLVYANTTLTNADYIKEIDYAPNTARFWRIVINGSSDVSDASWEWYLYGDENYSMLTTTHPANTTYYNASVPYSFQYQNIFPGMPAGFGENESCGYWHNGALTWLGNQPTGTAITGTLTAPLGQNNFTAFCGNATGGNNTQTVWFTYTDTYSFRAYNTATAAQINSFTINFYNSTNTTTYNTNTGWLNVSRHGLPYGNVTLEFTANGYRTTNYTRDVNDTTIIYENYPLSFSGVNITVYDEQTETPIYSTISIYNSTNTLTWGNTLNVTQALNDTLPSGDVTIDVSTANSSYYARRYYGTLNNNTFYELKAYLLNQSSSVLYVRFHIRDIASSPIANATVQILRAIGGGAGVVVGEMVTDDSGDAAFYMELGAAYSIQIVADGYLTYYTTINPSSNDYTITLTTATGGGATGLPLNVFEDINWWIIPSTALTSEMTNLTLTIYSSNSSLDYFGAAFYNSTGYQLYFVNATGSPNGGVIYYNHNSTNNTGVVTMEFWIKRNPEFVGNYTWAWLGGFFNNTQSSLNTTLGDLSGSGASSIGLGVLWLLITLILGAFVSRVNLMGGVIVTIATLAVGSYSGWMVFPAIAAGSTIGATLLVAGVGFAVIGLIYLKERV